MSFKKFSPVMFSFVGLLNACSSDSPATLSTNRIVRANKVNNGQVLNELPFDVEHEGVHYNGVSLNGISFNGISFNGLSFNGLSFNGISFNGSQLVGMIDTDAYPGTSLDNVTFTGNLSNSTTIPVRIDSSGWNSSDNAYNYYVSIIQDTAATPLCGLDSDNNPVRAIALQGTWDPDSGAKTDSTSQFTFGCVTGAVGKCVTWGYRPWDTVTEGSITRSMAPMHQACTRMVRADYCGDGQYHTRNGTPINIWDAVGLQTRDTSVGWDPEAEWTGAGAHCIHHTRWEAANGDIGNDLDYVSYYCSDRLAENDSNCGSTSSFDDSSNFVTGSSGDSSAFSTRRLLRNESEFHYDP